MKIIRENQTHSGPEGYNEEMKSSTYSIDSRLDQAQLKKSVNSSRILLELSSKRRKNHKRE